MIHFLHTIVQPWPVVLLAIWVFFLFNLVWAGAPAAYGDRRAYTIVPFICFLVVTVVAFIAWAFAVFA